jgi:hypothetical protein
MKRVRDKKQPPPEWRPLISVSQNTQLPLGILVLDKSFDA